MSFWIIIWVLISLALLGFAGWTLWILYHQKRTWKKFAAKHKMNYQSGSLMETPAISGVFHDYDFTLFACDHDARDGRTIRKLSAMELSLKSDVPFEWCLASRGMVPIIDALEYGHEYRPRLEKWNKFDAVIRGNSQQALKDYFTEERLEALFNLMKVKNGWVLFVVYEGKAVLRIDLPNPLEDEERLNKLAKRMLKISHVLELKDGERDVLIKGKAKDESVVLDVDETDIAETGLSLEDEGQA